MRPRLKVVVPSYNCSEWLERSLGSIESQTYSNFDVCVVDDGSTDPRHPEIVQEICQRNGWKAIISPKNESGIASLLKGIAALECEDDDIIVEVDGDDWLYNEQALQIVADCYVKENPLMTYGEMISFRSVRIGPGRHVRTKIARRRKFRSAAFIYSHLRTFKHVLWKNIRDEDLRGPDGAYMKAGWDVPMMMAMLEMAGLRFRYLPYLLYVYNDSNPISDYRIHAETQRRYEERARRLPPYEPLDIAKDSLRGPAFWHRLLKLAN